MKFPKYTDMYAQGESDTQYRKVTSDYVSTITVDGQEILKVEFCVNNTIKINEILNLVKKEGNTEVKIKIKDQNKNLVFILKNKRLVDRKSINMLKNQDILTTLY